jgi:cysteine-rich repeat protein
MKRLLLLLSLLLASCTLLPSKFLLLSLEGPPGFSVPEVERLDVLLTAQLDDGEKISTVTFDLSGARFPYTFVLEFEEVSVRREEVTIQVFGKLGDQTLLFASSEARIKNDEVSLLARFCGDAQVEPVLLEECDDGNAQNGDGCDNDCTLGGCGNGTVNPGEPCDDGNAVEGDGCDSNCTLSACGNGVTGGSEACDDGNAVEGDGCDSNCTLSACGNGIFAPGELCFVLSADTFPVGTAPQDIVAADFDGDGLIDLATANQNSNDVSLLLGLAGAQFSPATSISTGLGSLPRALAADDFDGDGDVDLAVAVSGTDQVKIVQNGITVFDNATITTLTVGNEPDTILAVDLTKDGRPEIITANFLSKNISVLENQSSVVTGISYKTQQVLATPGGAAASGPVALTSGNVDSDNSNSIDLLVPFSFENPQRSEVSFFANQNPNNGSLSFAPFSQRVPVASAGFNFISSVVAGDINEDGRLDVLYNNLGFNQVGILLGEDQGVFTQLGTTETLLPLGEAANQLLLEDLNDDGHLDLITLGSSLQVFVGDGTGQFTLSLQLPNNPSFSGTLSDFNGDSITDLAFLRNGRVSLLLSNP